MNAVEGVTDVKGKDRFASAKMLPREFEKVWIDTAERGSFVATRHGHDWRVGTVCADGDAWISYAIKDNDWWKYIK